MSRAVFCILAICSLSVSACKVDVRERPKAESCEAESCDGRCVEDLCCPSESNATAAAVVDGQCSFECDEGFTNAGTAASPDCKADDSCSEDLCAGDQLRRCVSGKPQLEDCESGACLADACCPLKSNATASATPGGCTYVCAEGFTNAGTAQDPSCEQSERCEHDVCDHTQLQVCDLATGELGEAQDCPTGACAAGACCPHHDHTLVSRVDGACNYACVGGYHNLGSATAPDCVEDCQQHECVGDQIRACVDGVLRAAQACSSGACSSGACACPDGYLNDGSATDPDCKVGRMCGGAAGRELLTRSAGSSQWTTDSCGSGGVCIQRDRSKPAACVDRDDLVMELRWGSSTPLLSIRSATDGSFGGAQNSFDVDCGNDGEYEFTGITGDRSVSCNSSSGDTVRLRGLMAYVSLGCVGATLRIVHWGDNPWLSMKGLFSGHECAVRFEDSVGPNLSQAVSLRSLFSLYQDNPDVSNWDVSHVRDMRWMFYRAYNFNRDLSSWDVSNVVDMSSMFQEASVFNADLSDWDVQNVTEHDDFSTDSGLSSGHLPSFPD